MAYDTDIFTGCDGLFYCIAQWSNSVTDGYFWSIMLLAFAIVVYMGSVNFGQNRAFGYASMSAALISLILIQMSLIPTFVLTIFLILAAFGVVSMLVSER